jgi:hypothetical protein
VNNFHAAAAQTKRHSTVRRFINPRRYDWLISALRFYVSAGAGFPLDRCDVTNQSVRHTILRGDELFGFNDLLNN